MTDAARKLDDEYPRKREHVTIDQKGEPILHKTVAREIPASAIALQERINARLPTRNVLDILANIEHWTHFTRHFGPLSGIDPQIRKAAERYLLTIFAMGCNLGPTQAARHLDTDVTAHMLSFVNLRHMNLDRLEAAQRELIELYLRLDLPKHWGDGKTVAATARSTTSTTTTCWPAITSATGKWVRSPTAMSPTTISRYSGISSRRASGKRSM